MGLNKMKNLIRIISPLILSTVLSAAPQIVTVGPATDANCQFSTTQDAVDSGGIINMDIRISNQLITDSGINITDKDISYIRGGYASCQDAINGIIDVSNPWSTVSNLADNGIHIVYSNDNFHTINLQRLKVTNSGFGIRIVKNGFNHTLIVNIDESDISNNNAAGIYASANSAGLIVNFDNGNISHNNAPQLSDFGGGIQCVGAEVNIGEFVSIDHNYALSGGGGISASGCDVHLSAGDSNSIGSLQYGIFSNTSSVEGAGVSLDFGSNLIAFGTEFHPVSISNNAIIVGGGGTTKGGGVFVGLDSTAQLANVRIDSNTSLHRGGGIYLSKDNGTGNAPQMTVGSLPEGCIYAEICNSISDNNIYNSAAVSSGVAIHIDDGALLTVAHTLFEGNSQSNVSVFKVSGGSQLNLLSDLIVNNVNDANLFDQDNLSSVAIHYSTLANNQVSNYFNVQYDNNNAQVLEVKGSIIQNGIATIANLNNDMGNHDAQVACSLVENDDGSGVVQNGSIIGDPGFVDSTNYKLSRNSIALNASCFPVGEFDIVRYDILGADRFGSGQPDLGAYEMGYLFSDGFE